MVGKGKSAKDHIVQGGSGISPQQKRSVKTPRKRKATLQTSISEWLADDDVGKQATQVKDMKTPPPHPLATQSDLGNMFKSYTFSALWESRDKCTLSRTRAPIYRAMKAFCIHTRTHSKPADLWCCDGLKEAHFWIRLLSIHMWNNILYKIIL